jgi:hypothetical protein
MADIAGTAISVTNLVGEIAKFGTQALPVAEFIAGFFPGMAPVLQAVRIAAPYIEKIAAAAPQVAAAIDKGRPIITAVEETAPTMLPNLKAIFAIAVNHDPADPRTNMTAGDVSDEQAMTFGGPVLFGHRWTDQETQRFWDRSTPDFNR